MRPVSSMAKFSYIEGNHQSNNNTAAILGSNQEENFVKKANATQHWTIHLPPYNRNSSTLSCGLVFPS